MSERCCRVGSCEYSALNVAVIIGWVKTARRHGVDITAQSVLARGGDDIGRAPNVATGLDLRRIRAVWDVQRGISETGSTNSEVLAARLCPWSGDPW